MNREQALIEIMLQVLQQDKQSESIEEESVWQVGKKYLIRGVVYQLGVLKKVTEKELVLTDACWVADTGGFTDALENGTLSEVEMFPAGHDVIVQRDNYFDATEWTHSLPTERK